MTIIHLGVAETFECSVCKERYTGPPADEATKAWQKNHRNLHWVGKQEDE